MLLTIAVTAVAIGICNVVHFYSLRQLGHIFRDHPPPVKRPILLVSFAIMVLHLAEVMIYAVAIWFLVVMERGALTALHPLPIEAPEEFFYFSVASYTSLGIGDIVPEGHVRILVGLEALQGLMLIAWSASFTYLVMERFWARGRPDILDDM